MAMLIASSKPAKNIKKIKKETINLSDRERIENSDLNIFHKIEY